MRSFEVRIEKGRSQPPRTHYGDTISQDKTRVQSAQDGAAEGTCVICSAGRQRVNSGKHAGEPVSRKTLSDLFVCLRHRDCAAPYRKLNEGLAPEKHQHSAQQQQTGAQYDLRLHLIASLSNVTLTCSGPRNGTLYRPRCCWPSTQCSTSDCLHPHALSAVTEPSSCRNNVSSPMSPIIRQFLSSHLPSTP